MWEETGEPEENPRVQVGNHHTLSDKAFIDPGDWTWKVVSEYVVHCATLTLYLFADQAIHM